MMTVFRRAVCAVLAALALTFAVGCSGGGSDAQPEETEAKKELKVDIDMTEMNATMVYTQVSDMVTNPDNYVGKVVKMSGKFNVYKGDTRNYYACIIPDATACCQQGIEFVLEKGGKYPDDYPAVDSEITVTGVFGTYWEGQYRYVELTSAKLG